MSIFNKNEKTRVRSNTFDLTHDVKLSANFGDLVPICVMETLPGDVFDITGNALVRLAPMIAPVMHRADMYMHYFFVPNRILWSNWEDFITGGRLGDNTSVHPYINFDANTNTPNTLYDYLGLPTSSDVSMSDPTQVSALPMAAYQKIYNDYYRDQNFQVEIGYELVDGDNDANNSLPNLRQRAWEHDYFTSALPWTQRGPEALLPLGDKAEIVFDPAQAGPPTPDQLVVDNTGAPLLNADLGSNGIGSLSVSAGATTAWLDLNDTHYADLSSATASSINDLRRAFRLQEWLEKNARGGARYIESIEMHFGVHSSDKRLQRAEYIGGFKTPMKFSEVLQTSMSASDVQTSETPQGNMAGHGIAVGGSRKYSYRCEEHGYIIGIASALPKTAYQQGIQKHFLREDKFDYAWPSFAHIGEQPIQNQEVYLSQAALNKETWGYTPRYSEYKFINNRVAGDFKNTLDFWHMGRKFASLPPLNQDFITMKPDEVSRIFAVENPVAPPLWIQVLNQVKARRKLPVFGTPTI